MKKLTLFFIGILSLSTHGSTELINFMQSERANNICIQDSKTIKSLITNGKYLFYLMVKGNQSNLLKINLYNSIESNLLLDEKVKDIEINESFLYVLTNEELVTYDLESFKELYRLRTLPGSMGYRNYRTARGLHIDDKNIYIAHGEYGVAVINRNNFLERSFINPSLPHAQAGHRSMVTDVVGNDKNLYIAFDNITLASKTRGFEGVGIWNKQKNELAKLVPLNQKIEAFYYPDIEINEKFLVMQNLHLIFKYDLNNLNTDRYLRPKLRIWKIDNAKFTHKALRFNEYMGGCTQNNETSEIKSILVRK